LIGEKKDMDLKYELYIDGKVEDVWNALISPEGTRKVFFGSVIQSTFKIGDDIKYILTSKDGTEKVYSYGKILDFEPYKIFSYTDHPGPSYSDHELLESRITYRLDEIGRCVKLTVVNDNWTEKHPMIESIDEAWWMILSSIKTLVETGKTLDFGY
jgi:uncharacterized protein YndB with AHSA1/START domain